MMNEELKVPKIKMIYAQVAGNLSGGDSSEHMHKELDKS